MAEQKSQYNLVDEGSNGWEFNQNPEEWDQHNIISWLEHLDEDFYDDYEEKFSFQKINGQHFQRAQLGNESWCRNNLGMDPQTATLFTKIVRKRITNYQNSQNNANEEIEVVKIDEIDISDIEDDENDNDNDQLSESIVVVPKPRINSIQNSPNRPILNQNGPGSPGSSFSWQQIDNNEHKIDENVPVTPGGVKVKVIQDNKVDFMNSIDNLPRFSVINQNNNQNDQNDNNMQEAMDAVNAALKPLKPPPIQQLKPVPQQQIDWKSLGPPPDLPFSTHGAPSLKSMSNKFRQKGPNKIMYPPKNGPIAICKRLNLPIDQLPDVDPYDEICGNPIIAQEIPLKFAEELSMLTMMGFNDHNKNLRILLRLKDSKDRIPQVMAEYEKQSKYTGIYIGDRVVRGPDWKWADQDGGRNLEGTVRGLRQWHPKDPPNVTTEVVVLWDHGLYGNYRYGYKGAYDVKVVDRWTDEKHNDDMIHVGQRVMRGQPNWRWGNQDGGMNGIGTIIELYASPAPFEGGARVAVLWDHQRAQYRKKAEDYLKAHPKGDDEWYADDEKLNDDNDENGSYQNGKYMDANAVWNKLDEHKNKMNPHKTRRKRKKYIPPQYESDEHSSEWDEPDFEEILSKPIAKYRWSLRDPSLSYPANDLELSHSKALPEQKYLMIDDRVRQSKYFRARRRPPKSDSGIVLKVEQSDARRVNANQIKGDKVYTTWSSYQSYTFGGDDGVDDIEWCKRGQVFKDKYARIKVGDRVRRGMTWKNEYGEEDGGHQAKGTVVCVSYVLQVAGILAKVRWDKNGHTNFYSWGFKDIYDLKKAEPGL